MKYVYLIRSIPHPDQHYVGITDTINTRILHHNSGGSKLTSKCKPWGLVTYVTFKDSEQARAFEK